MGRDWIMRATADTDGREQALARAAMRWGAGVRSAAVGGLRDGGRCYTLMRDVSAWLIGRRRVAAGELDAVVGGMAALHGLAPPDGAVVPWCPVARRLSLLSRERVGVLRRCGVLSLARELQRGWSLFFTRAPAAAVEVVRGVAADFGVLERALAVLPSRFLHGDLKLDNVGLEPSGGVWLIDWAMLMHAPAAVELGWFLAINSRQIEAPLDEVLALYCDTVGLDGAVRPRLEALSAVCGLLLRGWRKALDADGGDATELAWWCERAVEAQRFL